MPAKATIRMRTLLPYQLYRFGAVNLKMLELARRSHTPLTWGAPVGHPSRNHTVPA